MILLACLFVFLAGIYLFKVDDRKTIAMYQICSKLAIKTLEQRYGCRSSIFIVNFYCFHILFWCFHWWRLISKDQLCLYLPTVSYCCSARGVCFDAFGKIFIIFLKVLDPLFSFSFSCSSSLIFSSSSCAVFF